MTHQELFEKARAIVPAEYKSFSCSYELRGNDRAQYTVIATRTGSDGFVVYGGTPLETLLEVLKEVEKLYEQEKAA